MNEKIALATRDIAKGDYITNSDIQWRNELTVREALFDQKESIIKMIESKYITTDSWDKKIVSEKWQDGFDIGGVSNYNQALDDIKKEIATY